MDPDEFLDWLEDKRKDVSGEDEGNLLESLIDDFNNEFDTRDSPLPEPVLGRRKKKPKLTGPIQYPEVHPHN